MVTPKERSAANKVNAVSAGRGGMPANYSLNSSRTGSLEPSPRASVSTPHGSAFQRRAQNLPLVDNSRLFLAIDWLFASLHCQ